MNPGKIFRSDILQIDASLRGKILCDQSRLPFTPRLAFAFNRPFLRRQSGAMQRLPVGVGKMRRRCARHSWRPVKKSCPRVAGANVILENFAVAGKWPRFARVGRVGCGTGQWSFVQRLHTGVPIECENLALLKAELLYAAIRKRGLSLRERILSRPDLLGKLSAGSALGERSAEFRAVASPNGKNDRHLGRNDRCRNMRVNGSIDGSISRSSRAEPRDPDAQRFNRTFGILDFAALRSMTD